MHFFHWAFLCNLCHLTHSFIFNLKHFSTLLGYYHPVRASKPLRKSFSPFFFCTFLKGGNFSSIIIFDHSRFLSPYVVHAQNLTIRSNLCGKKTQEGWYTQKETPLVPLVIVYELFSVNKTHKFTQHIAEGWHEWQEDGCSYS